MNMAISICVIFFGWILWKIYTRKKTTPSNTLPHIYYNQDDFAKKERLILREIQDEATPLEKWISKAVNKYSLLWRERVYFLLHNSETDSLFELAGQKFIAPDGSYAFVDIDPLDEQLLEELKSWIKNGYQSETGFQPWDYHMYNVQQGRNGNTIYSDITKPEIVSKIIGRILYTWVAGKMRLDRSIQFYNYENSGSFDLISDIVTCPHLWELGWHDTYDYTLSESEHVLYQYFYIQEAFQLFAMKTSEGEIDYNTLQIKLIKLRYEFAHEDKECEGALLRHPSNKQYITTLRDKYK